MLKTIDNQDLLQQVSGGLTGPGFPPIDMPNIHGGMSADEIRRIIEELMKQQQN
jgi:hypothetical protein